VNGFPLDTNIISQLIKGRPIPGSESGSMPRDEGLPCLSVLTLGKICEGIASLPDASRRARMLYRLYSFETELRVTTQMLAPSKATEPGKEPSPNVPRFFPSHARSLVTLLLP